jgi:flagellar basal-body rod protein FlgC
MSFFNALDTSASALTAQRLRMDVISQNIANVNTTRTADGGPYKRKVTVFQEAGAGTFKSALSQAEMSYPAGRGVRVYQIKDDDTPGSRVYEPGHPDADADGYVTIPNVNVVEEMVDMISASRSYEANVTVINSTKQMIARTTDIGR